MNQTEWKKLANLDKSQLDWTYYNKSKVIQKSLVYNPDPNATIKHHLRDTPEQREYNDKYYELWGHNLDGTFEYGKYMIFMTPEEHNKLHSCSDETRERRGAAMRGKHHTEETKKKLSESHSGENNPMYGKCGELCPAYGRTGELSPWYGKHHTEESKLKMSNAQLGEKHWNYGGHLSDSQKKKISEFHTGRKRPPETGLKIQQALKDHYAENPMTDDTKDKISESLRKYFAEHNISDETRQKLSIASTGRTHTDEAKKKMSTARSEYLAPIRIAYKEYKSNNGTLKWNEFCKWYHDNSSS